VDIREVILQEAKNLSPTAGTIDGLKLLHLEVAPENYYAANHYVEALRMILILFRMSETLLDDFLLEHDFPF
jgi:hypothetical protein